MKNATNPVKSHRKAHLATKDSRWRASIRALSDADLESVAGGSASTKLYEAVCTGKHFKKASIEIL